MDAVEFGGEPLAAAGGAEDGSGAAGAVEEGGVAHVGF